MRGAVDVWWTGNGSSTVTSTFKGWPWQPSVGSGRNATG
jgi:hypothetical protein